jgi:glycerol-3-phosphate dehydrogenase
LKSDEVVNPSIKQRLLNIYGSRTRHLLKLCERDARLRAPLNASSEILAGEIVFAFEHEFAQRLTDCLFRRTMSGLSSDLGMSEVEDAAAVGQKVLGWSAQRAEQEIENYRAYIQRFAVLKET